ncbi:MAG: hypothetical protein RLY31_1694 [Bacteroidota bacterium]
MNDYSILQRLSNARQALKSTIQKILDLNRQLKLLRRNRRQPEEHAIKKELKLLNKVADQQARIVQLYEHKLRRTGNE